MKIFKPYHIQSDSRIGIVQTSDSDWLFPNRYQRACRELQRIFPGKLTDYTEYSRPLTKKCTEKIYAERLMQAVEENEIILSLTGGYTTNCMLPYLDYDRIREKRPLICGYSDTTALLQAVYSKSGLVCVYGPALLGTFGEWPHANRDSIASLRQVLFSEDDVWTYDRPQWTSDLNYFWDKEDMQALRYEINRPWQSGGTGRVEGILTGGNLNTLLAIAHTEFWRMPEHGVLFLEDGFTQPGRFKRDLETLRQMGIFEQVEGVLLGKFFQSGSETEKQRMNRFAMDYLAGLGIPVLTGVDFGHSYPGLSIPIGIRARVDFEAGAVTILEKVVSE